MEVLESTCHEKPCVSVLCPVYNHEKYLRRMLDSVLRQKTDFPYEVLVHDDASTDSSARILREAYKNYADKLTIVFQDENQYSQGVAVNPTFLFPRARGKYLAFCEGDDFWSDEHKLQQQYEAMEANPSCGICVHKVRRIWESGKSSSRTYPDISFNEGILRQKWLVDQIVSRGQYLFQTSSYFIRSSIMLDDEGCKEANKKLAYWGDEGYIRIALAAGDFYYIDDEMSCYRQFSNGSWSSKQVGSEAAAQRCRKMKSVNEEFNKLTGGSFAPCAKLGNQFADLLYLIGTGAIRAAYNEHNSEHYKYLSRIQRIEVGIGRIHPICYRLIQWVRKRVMGLRCSR